MDPDSCADGEEFPQTHRKLDVGVCIEEAKKVLWAILSRVLSETKKTITDDVKASTGLNLGLEVWWMANGGSASFLQETSAVRCVSDMKASREANDAELVLGKHSADPRVTNIAHFRCSSTFEALCNTGFTLVRKVNTGINGDIFKYRWSRGQNNLCVAVKKLRNSTLKNLANAETDERSIHVRQKHKYQSDEDSLTEIGVLQHLSRQQDLPLYLLKMLGVFSEDTYTWLVTEFADGGELFDVAASGGIAQKRIQEYMWQLLQAVGYLHRHSIGHRDISMENVLLKDDTVRLMDFGMAVCSHSSSGAPLRYFCEVGKPFYRAPECYVPTHEEVQVMAPLSSAPGDVVMVKVTPGFLCEVRLPENIVPGTNCSSKVWGYAATPADMFAVGICMFILAFQCPAWESARLSNRFFAHVYNSNEKGLESLLKMWGKHQVLSPEAMDMLSDMLQAEPAKRPSASSCLNCLWFATMCDRDVPLHNVDPDN